MPSVVAEAPGVSVIREGGEVARSCPSTGPGLHSFILLWSWFSYSPSYNTREFTPLL